MPGSNGENRALGGNGQDRAGPLLTFPCRYDIKAVGRQSARFDALVQAIVTRHVDPQDLLAVNRRLSTGEQYMSITFTIKAQSYDQLGEIYRGLSACHDVLFCI